jgi:hypothetical protein
MGGVWTEDVSFVALLAGDLDSGVDVCCYGDTSMIVFA